MSTVSTPTGRDTEAESPQGYGWVMFAGVITAIIGTLNVIYGIAAIDNANFFVHGTHYVFGSLKTFGWVTLIIGVVQLIAAVSIWRGGQFGRILGICGASLNMISALLAIPAYPFLALAIFAMDVLIVYGLVAYGGFAKDYR